MKVLKPSMMGLHSTVRCEVKLKGNNQSEQIAHLISFAEELYAFINRFNHDGEAPETVFYTQKFARFVSKSFKFFGYSDDEIFQFMDRSIDRMRKSGG